jgi:hypothetical protein
MMEASGIGRVKGKVDRVNAPAARRGHHRYRHLDAS